MVDEHPRAGVDLGRYIVSICITDILGMVVLTGGVETGRKGRIRGFGVAALIAAGLFGVETRKTPVRFSAQTASGERI